MKLIKFFILIFAINSAAKSLAAPLLIDDPATVSSYEAQGLSFAELVLNTKVTDNKSLSQFPVYEQLVQQLEGDLQDLRKKDPQLGPGMKFNHRQFHAGWLRSPSARFELVGIANRLDRAVFNPTACGEVRLIYRLAYQKKQNATQVESRLPMTLNLVYLFPNTTSCKEIALQWQDLKIENLKKWLIKSNLKSLEMNLQAARWPSTIRGDMGGHAEYFLRVYKFNPHGHFNLAPLENTPDVELLTQNPQVKKELFAFLLEPKNLQSLDQGTLNIPEKFLARKTSSFALHGMNRLANRPFDQIFKKEDFNSVDFSRLEYIYGPSSLRRRLNDMTCAGCHQGRTIAGFHFLGTDPAKTVFANSIYSSRSPHLIDELERRNSYVQDLISDKTLTAARPFSERNAKVLGKLNDHCGFPNSEFQKWKCEAGLTCTSIITPSTSSEIGLCLPSESLSGLPCEPGTITQTANEMKDSMNKSSPRSCGNGYVCQATRVGFPGGMCSHGCSNLKPGEECGSIAILQGFNDCLAAKKPFTECLEKNTHPAALQGCDESRACREDYICTRTKENKGTCIPPYFLFQLRVDGHPEP